MKKLVYKSLIFYKKYGFKSTIHRIIEKSVDGRRKKILINQLFQNENWPPYAGTVSVVIPAYNGAKELSSLIPVLHAQEKVKKVEIIIVDSGSHDGTVDIARTLGAKVVCISQKEFSHSYARNLGASYASGEYLLFMTQDAMPKGNTWLIKMLQPALQKDVVAVSCQEMPKPDCDLFGRFSVYSHSKYMGMFSDDQITMLPKIKSFDKMRRSAQLDDVSCLIRRDVFSQYQYRGDFAEDLDLGLRLIKDHYKLAMLSSAQVIHSHTRPPFYHLRRSIVDVKTIQKIFPNFPVEKNVSAQTVANRIISVYSLLALFLHEAKDDKGVSDKQQNFLAWSSGVFKRLEAEVSKMSIAEIQNLVQMEIQYMDENTVSLVRQIAKEYMSHFEFDSLIITEQRNLLENLLPEYLHELHEKIELNLRLEVCDFLCKHFAQCSGTQLAALLLSNDNGMLKQLAEECSFGI